MKTHKLVATVALVARRYGLAPCAFGEPWLYVAVPWELTTMREGIHPNYQQSKIVCACGNVIETRSTLPEIHVELCSACHPFYTGKQKLVDTAGRVDRFNRKYGVRK